MRKKNGRVLRCVARKGRLCAGRADVEDGHETVSQCSSARRVVGIAALVLATGTAAGWLSRTKTNGTDLIKAKAQLSSMTDVKSHRKPVSRRIPSEQLMAVSGLDPLLAPFIAEMAEAARD
jgi:hypothetical protein